MTAVDIIKALAEHWFVFLVFAMLVGWTLAEMTKFVAKNWRKASEAKHQAGVLENEAKLKALMVQRGMPPEEIERVLSAGSGSLQNDAGVRLEELMIEQGMDADDIQRVLRARNGDTSNSAAEAEIVEALVAEDYEAEDISEILSAARINSKIDSDAVRLVRVMAENAMESDDIARVLRARRTGKVITMDVAATIKEALGGKADQVIKAVTGEDDQSGPQAPTRSA